MIQALFFDLGGVLLAHDVRRALAGFARLSGRPAAELEAPLLEVAKQGFDLGRMDARSFVLAVERACGRPIGEAKIREVWCDIFDDCPGMQALAERLAASLPSYLLSNTDPFHFEHARARVPALSRFRGHHLSYEVGRLKPDLEYYRLAFRRFELPPEACVLIDDRPENVEAIVRLGASGIVHVELVATERELRRLGVSA